MQKVEGSNPFSRFFPANRALFGSGVAAPEPQELIIGRQVNARKSGLSASIRVRLRPCRRVMGSTAVDPLVISLLSPFLRRAEQRVANWSSGAGAHSVPCSRANHRQTGRLNREPPPVGSPAVTTTSARYPERPFAFLPTEVTVRAGRSVRWIADDDVFHTVTSTDALEPRQPNGRFNRSLSRRGQTFRHTFHQPGTFHYYCQPHSQFMFGTVHVVEAGQ
jgi:plastocyanin